MGLLAHFCLLIPQTQQVQSKRKATNRAEDKCFMAGIREFFWWNERDYWDEVNDYEGTIRSLGLKF
jgi:hypothetical protein